MEIELRIENNSLVVRLLGERSGTWGYGEIASASLPLWDLREALKRTEDERETKE